MRLILAAVLLGLAACGPKGDVYEKRELETGVFEIRNNHGVFEYLSARHAKEAGIGVRIGPDASGIMSVIEVFPGSPAEVSGILVGDKLLTAQGKPLKGLEVEEAASHIRGRPGSPLDVEYQREGKRAKLTVPRAREVMQFTKYPPGLLIAHDPKPKDADCPKTRGVDCRFLVDTGSNCFYSCPMQ